MSNLVEVCKLRLNAKTDSGQTVEIIRGVSFDVAEGEIVALIGESDFGKTTTGEAQPDHHGQAGNR